MTEGDVLLAIAVAAFTPEGRRENPPAMRLAWRIEKLDPVPDGFREITEAELFTYYRAMLRPPGYVAPSLEGIAMTPEEAERLYRTHLSREALRG